MKVMTLCGSLKFKEEMMSIAEKMALKGVCVLTPVYPVLRNYKITEEQLIKLRKAHLKRIELKFRNRICKEIRKRNFILYRFYKKYR